MASNGKRDEVLVQPVYLIGFMGAGKSTIGRRLARRYGFETVDADDYLEQRERRSISQIFAQDGEDAFREMESRCLKELSQAARIICTGGGVVKRDENRLIMHEYGFAIYLHVTARAAASRISDLSTRPLFKDLETASAIVEERIPLYEAAADAKIDTIGRTPDSISCEVVELLRARGIVVPRS